MTSNREILILTHWHDFHGYVVERALRRKGARARRWHGCDFGSDQDGTLSVSSEEPWRLSGTIAGNDFEDRLVSTVWARRPVVPNVPPAVDARDAEQALQENMFFVQAAWWRLHETAFWVNPYTARRWVKSKPAQLESARQVGLSVPATLYSNRPADIRAFAAFHDNQIIYKPHRVVSWQENDREWLIHTSRLPNISEYSDQQIGLIPGLFQKEVKKAYELRVHVMGDFILAAKIESQESEASNLDWRNVDYRTLAVENYTLPAPIAEKLRAFMKRMGIVFGVIDMIVTPDGDYVFLEVNENGQFLWVERANPTLRVLDTFCSFLIHGAADFDGTIVGADTPYEEIGLAPDAFAAFEGERATNPPPDYSIPWIDLLL